MRWGLVPSWWKKPLRELPSTFNARAETVAEKPMFRAALEARRCLIPASGFYEWTGKPGAKTPHISPRRTARRSSSRGFGTSGATAKAARIFCPRRSSSAPPMIGWRDFTTACRRCSRRGFRRLARVDAAAALLRPAREDALREWIVSTRVNRSGADDEIRRCSRRCRPRQPRSRSSKPTHFSDQSHGSDAQRPVMAGLVPAIHATPRSNDRKATALDGFVVAAEFNGDHRATSTPRINARSLGVAAWLAGTSPAMTALWIK